MSSEPAYVIEEATLRPDQVARLTEMHIAVIPIDGDLEIYRVEFPHYVKIGFGGIRRGGLVRTRWDALVPLDVPMPKEPPPTMFKRVTWTDETPARVIGMTVVE